MTSIVTPKFAVPFTIGRRANTVEQGSLDEIIQCVKAALKTPIGMREDNPKYGLPDQAFREGGANLDEIRRVLTEFEPRAAILSDKVLIGLLTEVNIRVGADGQVS